MPLGPAVLKWGEGIDALNRTESMAVPRSISHHNVKPLGVRSAPRGENRRPSAIAVSDFTARTLQTGGSKSKR